MPTKIRPPIPVDLQLPGTLMLLDGSRVAISRQPGNVVHLWPLPEGMHQPSGCAVLTVQLDAESLARLDAATVRFWQQNPGLACEKGAVPVFRVRVNA